MKQLAFLLKSALLAGVFALAFAGCSKDDDEVSELNGTWMFKEINYLYYVDGQVFNAKEENPATLQETNRNLRGFFFVFNSGNCWLGMNGQTSSDSAPYTVSGDKITLKSGSTTFIMQYAISGENMDLIWSRSTFEMMFGALPDEFYYFDDVEAILSFNRVN
jgi:hypothetical protein